VVNGLRRFHHHGGTENTEVGQKVETMNQRKEKTTITIENYRRTVIRSQRNLSNLAVCEPCGLETTMILPHEAAKILQTTAREVFRFVESGQVHFLEGQNGELLICSKSCQNLQRIDPVFESRSHR